MKHHHCKYYERLRKYQILAFKQPKKYKKRTARTCAWYQNNIYLWYDSNIIFSLFYFLNVILKNEIKPHMNENMNWFQPFSKLHFRRWTKKKSKIVLCKVGQIYLFIFLLWQRKLCNHFDFTSISCNKMCWINDWARSGFNYIKGFLGIYLFVKACTTIANQNYSTDFDLSQFPDFAKSFLVPSGPRHW